LARTPFLAALIRNAVILALAAEHRRDIFRRAIATSSKSLFIPVTLLNKYGSLSRTANASRENLAHCVQPASLAGIGQKSSGGLRRPFGAVDFRTAFGVIFVLALAIGCSLAWVRAGGEVATLPRLAYSGIS
jgi:hypothetical protein